MALRLHAINLYLFFSFLLLCVLDLFSRYAPEMELVKHAIAFSQRDVEGAVEVSLYKVGYFFFFSTEHHNIALRERVSYETKPLSLFLSEFQWRSLSFFGLSLVWGANCSQLLSACMVRHGASRGLWDRYPFRSC